MSSSKVIIQVIIRSEVIIQANVPFSVMDVHYEVTYFMHVRRKVI